MDSRGDWRIVIVGRAFSFDLFHVQIADRWESTTMFGSASELFAVHKARTQCSVWWKRTFGLWCQPWQFLPTITKIIEALFPSMQRQHPSVCVLTVYRQWVLVSQRRILPADAKGSLCGLSPDNGNCEGACGDRRDESSMRSVCAVRCVRDGGQREGSKDVVQRVEGKG